MNKMKWNGFGLLLLTVLLFIGLSYLSLHKSQTTDENQSNEEPPMSIALVNEDEGTVFNDTPTDLGDDFTKSIIQNDRHDWYVVSRGIAENGINRDVYDMMIVIPTNFSERSLAFQSENPEPVSLQYKINTTGHEDVRATAEKTARNILSDFNRKLVNVYFASIIGNLQDAQDNVTEIVEMDKLYTDKYRSEINSSLSNYTDQFDKVRNYTENTKDNFLSFEDVLYSFEASLEDDLGINQEFASEIDQVMQMKDDGSEQTETFSKYLNDFTQRMTSELVTSNLASLQSQNALIHHQFQYHDDEERSIVDHSKKLQNQFAQMGESMTEYKEQLEKKLQVELKEVIEKIFADEEIDESYVNTMRELFKGLDYNVKAEIEKQINALPMLSLTAIEQSALVDDRKNEISKIAEIANKYIAENDIDYQGENSDLISEEIKEIKNLLVYEGTTAQDFVELPDEIKNEEVDNRKLYISVPEIFTLTEVSINGELITNNGQDAIDISGYNDNFDLNIALRLNQEDKDQLDVLAPVEWQWKIVQNDQDDHANGKSKKSNVEEIAYSSDSSLTMFHTQKVNSEDHKANELNLKGPLSSNDEDENNDESTGSSESKENDSEQDEEGNNNENDQDQNNDDSDEIEENPEEGESDGEGSDEESEEESEEKDEIVIRNNYIYKKIQSPIQLNVTDQIVSKNIEFISSYYELQSMLELYYGFDISDLELDDLALTDIATEDSLYYFIYHNEIEDILRDYLVDEVNVEVKDLMEELNISIDSYIRLLSEAGAESKELAEEIATTRDNSIVLNEDVEEMLEELAAWREASEALLENNQQVVSSDGEMNTAVMSLNMNYQPLILSSENLKERANNNLDSASNVYETLETIDNQAEEINTSGVNIVTKGNELAEDMLQNYVDNANFADNFNEVLDNSRIRDRQNHDLYQFLSNPVHIENNGIIKSEEESLSPYFLVIVLFITTMFTAYVIHSFNEKRLITVDNDKSLIENNLPISSLTAGIGLVLGLTIGLITFYLLQLSQSQLFLWNGIIVLLTMTLLFVATYLLRQLQTIGMFILLTIFGLYLILTKTLGFHFDNPGLIETMQKISPLQYVESLLSKIVIDNGHISLLVFLLLVGLIIIGYVLNLLVFRKPLMEKEMGESGASEAN